MARRIETLLLDDLDGSTDDVETITLGWGGRLLEIDLGKENRSRLDRALDEFVAAARPVGPLRGAPAPRPSRAAVARANTPAADGDDVDRAAVRAWARSQGEAIGDRGRIPGRILEAYRAATAPAAR